eukprot:scaffold30424_cov27-Prasinocladus_malaysianus.AAC.6
MENLISSATVYIACIAALQLSGGVTESWLGPLITVDANYCTGVRSPDSGGALCVGFLERSSLCFAALHGLHTVLVIPLITPGAPEHALLNLAISLGGGIVEHWLRYWDAVKAHDIQISFGQEGIVSLMLYVPGDPLLAWQAAVLSMAVYLANAVALKDCDQ